MFLKWTPERGNKQKCKLTMRTLVKLISNFNFTICNWQIDFCHSFEFEKNFGIALVWMSNICLGIELDFVKIPELCTMTLWIYADVEFGAQWGQQISELQKLQSCA